MTEDARPDDGPPKQHLETAGSYHGSRNTTQQSAVSEGVLFINEVFEYLCLSKRPTQDYKTAAWVNNL